MTNLPFTGKFKVTCEYGRKGNLWAAGKHTGIDLVGIDSKYVYATCDGTVSKVGYDAKGYGNYVVIHSTDGDYHWLCHLASVSVSAGQTVSRVKKIGIMGSTGNVTGAHTHFEIRTSANKYGVTKNPAEYMGIPNTVGTYDSNNYKINTNTTTTEPTTPSVEYYPKCTIETNSIVDALKSIGVDSSMKNRQAIAKANGITNYTGTAAQNITLLNKIKEGKLVK